MEQRFLDLFAEATVAQYLAVVEHFQDMVIRDTPICRWLLSASASPHEIGYKIQGKTFIRKDVMEAMPQPE